MTVTQAIKIATDGSSALERPEYRNRYVLSANTAKSVTIPGNASTVIFSATEDFYVQYSGTADVPTSDITTGAAPELNPTIRSLLPGDTISLISAAACVVTVAFFK